MEIRRIAIVSIPVSNPQASKDFYADLLGFDVLRDSPMGSERRWIQLAPTGAEASITLVDWFDQMPPGCVQGLVLETEDLDTDHEALRDRGLTISDVEEAPWGRYATFSDPDGNGWVLQEASAD